LGQRTLQSSVKENLNLHSRKDPSQVMPLIIQDAGNSSGG
jgi:hypothetical protein